MRLTHALWLAAASVSLLAAAALLLGKKST